MCDGNLFRTPRSRVLAYFYPGEVSSVTNIMGRGSWKTDVYDIPGLKSHSTLGDKDTASVHSCKTSVESTNSPRPGASGGRGEKLNGTFREEEEVVR